MGESIASWKHIQSYMIASMAFVTNALVSKQLVNLLARSLMPKNKGCAV